MYRIEQDKWQKYSMEQNNKIQANVESSVLKWLLWAGLWADFPDDYSTREVFGAFMSYHTSQPSSESLRKPCVVPSHAHLCHIPSRQNEAFPFTNKPLHATEKLAAFLICVWIQIKRLWSFLAAGLSTGSLTTLKKHRYRLCNQCRLLYIDYLGRE